MTDFIDHRLSDKVAYGFSGGPSWNTLRKDLLNGRNRKRPLWAMPQHRFTANYSLLDATEKEEVLSAFWVCRGRAFDFRFKDFNDYKARPANVDGIMAMAVPATDTTPIQLTKTYSFGPTDYERVITLPLDVELLFDSGAGFVPFADYTLDPLTGILTPDTAWPAGTPGWMGEHDVRVCFSNDFNPFSRDRPLTSSTMVELEENWPAEAA